MGRSCSTTSSSRRMIPAVTRSSSGSPAATTAPSSVASPLRLVSKLVLIRKYPDHTPSISNYKSFDFFLSEFERSPYSNYMCILYVLSSHRIWINGRPSQIHQGALQWQRASAEVQSTLLDKGSKHHICRFTRRRRILLLTRYQGLCCWGCIFVSAAQDISLQGAEKQLTSSDFHSCVILERYMFRIRAPAS